MKYRKDISGNKYGRLTVVEYVGNDKYSCVCDCGNTVICESGNIKNGHTQSCGCLQKERTTKHNMSNTKLFKVWYGMISRCINANGKQYKDYGGRGITVCDEWLNAFKTFYDWSMANGYKEGLTLDRINVNGNYEPANCRWATRQEQSNNMRKNVFIEYKGEKKTIAQFAREYDINPSTLHSRIFVCGWSVEKALTTRNIVR